jgi:hypothetical protein
MYKLASNKSIFFITFIVCIMPFLAMPTLIDGISYFKVFLAMMCITPFVPMMLKRIYENRSGKLIGVLIFAIVLNILLTMILFPNDYRAIFGAPGRHNGAISLLLYIYFTVFGLYVYIKNKIDIVLIGLVISSCLTCIVSLIQANFLQVNLIPSLDFNDSQFRDNVDNIAPLISMALTASIMLYLKSKNPAFLILQIPAIAFLLEWKLLQSLVSLIPSAVLIILLRRDRGHRLLVLSPILIPGVYIGSLAILPLTPLANDSSIFERYQILKIFLEIKNSLSILPLNIEALSDFTSTTKIFSPNFVDDFHNVYLQLFFSFGVVIGLAITFSLLIPFLTRAWRFDNSSLVLPVYFNFIIGLLFAIASPNFMLFGFIFLGYLLGGLLDKPIRKQGTRERYLLSIGVLILITSTAFLQLNDFAKRVDISNAVRSYNSQEVSREYFENLTEKVSGIRDSEYKYQVARNFYTVGECTQGNLVYEQLIRINPREYRVSRLDGLRELCVQV